MGMLNAKGMIHANQTKPAALLYAALLAAVCAVVLSFASSFATPITAFAANDEMTVPKRVLFVGNSFTFTRGHGVDEMLVSIARANEKLVEADHITYNSGDLAGFVSTLPSRQNRVDNLNEKLTKGNWDYVVLQEKTKYPITDPTNMYLSVNLLVKKIHDMQPQARVVLYMTHGYDDGTSTEVNGVPRHLSAWQMSAYVQGYYTRLGEKLGLDVVPVGMYFNKYAKATNAETVIPSVIETDNKHPNRAGFFLAGCAFYSYIFEEPPTKVSPDAICPSASAQNLMFGLMESNISAAPKSATLSVGQTMQFSYTITKKDEPQPKDDQTSDNQSNSSESADPNDNKTSGESTNGQNGSTDVNETPKVTVTSLDPNIATIDSNGLVRAVSAGKTVISAETENGEVATCYLSVEPDDLLAQKILFREQKMTITTGGNVLNQPEVSESLGAYSLSWKSSDKKIAKVDYTGRVTAKKAGRVTITATDTATGYSGQYVLTVRLAQPKNMKVKSIAGKSSSKAGYLKISWSSVKNAKKYKVYRAQGANGAFTLIGATKNRSFTDKKLRKNKLTRYRVVAVNGKTAQRSLPSEERSGIALGPPSKLTVLIDNGRASLSWNKRVAAQGYSVYRARGNGKFKLVQTLATNEQTAWVDTKVKAGKTYRYKVAAFRTCDNKRFSSPSSKTVSVVIGKKATTYSSTMTSLSLAR